MSGRIDLAGNRGPLVNIAAWFTLVVAIIATGMKFYIKRSRIGVLQLDDLFIGISALFAICSCVTTAEQISNGLGKDIVRLSTTQIDRFYLYSYLTSFFYILTTFTSKLAAYFFFVCLSRPGVNIWMSNALIACVAIWTLIAIFVTSFQCALPRTWDLTQGPGHCSNQHAFWIIHGVVDILTQLAAAFLPVYLLWNIQTRGLKKLFSMFSFSINILTLPLIIARLVFLPQLYSLPSDNATSHSFALFLITILHSNMSIIFATLPFSKPVIDSLSIGIISNDMTVGLRWDQRAGIVSGSSSSGRGGGPSSNAIYGWRKLPGRGGANSKSGGDTVKSFEQETGIELGHTAVFPEPGRTRAMPTTVSRADHF